MIMKRTKGALLAFMAAVALCFGLAGAAYALATDSEVSFSQEGTNVGVTLDGHGTDVSAFSLILDVDVSADVDDAVQVGFEFSDQIVDGTKIHESTLKPSGDKTRITLYVAGGDDLFASSLYVGRITLGLDESLSSGAEVVVEVPASDEDEVGDRGSVYALRTVTSSHAEDEGGVYQTEPFTAYLGDRATEQPPASDGNGGDGNGGSGNNGGNGNDNGGGITGGVNGGGVTTMGPEDGYGPVDPNRNLTNVGGSTGNLSNTGDPLVPIVVTLLCVIAVALCAMGFLIIKRRRQG